jgi:UDP-2-acetamido-3-amino-2,3-dideoxy-glucuronate N-acetyltransferase
MGKRESVKIAKTAIVDKSARIGKGTAIWHFAQVMRDTVIGRNCTIGNGAFIDRHVVIGNNVKIMNRAQVFRGVIIGDGCFIGPLACFINDKNPRSSKTRPIKSPKWTVCSGASIGAGALILCDVNIGKHALVGAGSLVTKNVAAHELVVGIPARPAGYVCFCGEKLKKKRNSYYCASCAKNVDI